MRRSRAIAILFLAAVVTGFLAFGGFGVQAPAYLDGLFILTVCGFLASIVREMRDHLHAVSPWSVDR